MNALTDEQRARHVAMTKRLLAHAKREDLPDGYEFNSALGAVALALSAMLSLNVILGIYNLIPLPPLDGAAVVEGFGPSVIRRFYDVVRSNPLYQVLGLVISWRLFPYIAEPAQRALARVLYS